MLAKIPYICTLVTGTKFKLLSNNTWSRRKKPVSYYVNEMMSLMFRQAGISPSIKPSIPYLPTVSLTQVEFTHNMMNHILTRICKDTKNSMFGFETNDTVRAIANNIWYKLIDCDFRPSDCGITHLRDSDKDQQTNLKSVAVFRSAFELAVHGGCIGFNSFNLSILQDLIN